MIFLNLCAVTVASLNVFMATPAIGTAFYTSSMYVPSAGTVAGAGLKHLAGPGEVRRLACFLLTAAIGVAVAVMPYMHGEPPDMSESWQGE